MLAEEEKNIINGCMCTYANWYLLLIWFLFATGFFPLLLILIGLGTLSHVRTLLANINFQFSLSSFNFFKLAKCLKDFRQLLQNVRMDWWTTNICLFVMLPKTRSNAYHRIHTHTQKTYLKERIQFGIVPKNLLFALIRLA